MLEVRRLTKRYTGVTAVDDVSFAALAGEVTGYLGPNGSGKSTTVKIITGLLESTDGDVLYKGRPIRDHLVEYKTVLGYVPEEPYLYPHLTGSESLELTGALRDLPEGVARQNRCAAGNPGARHQRYPDGIAGR